MPKFRVVRDIVVDMPAKKVFTAVSNFNNWSRWSPWIIHEPEAKVSVSRNPGSVGHKQEWDGKYIGSGSLKILKSLKNKSIEYSLEFLKPWKSRAKTAITFEDVGKQCKITWSLQGSLPLFMFFMKKQMVAFIASDYERGLSMLKEDLETGTVLSSLTRNGVVDGEAFSYIGREKTSSLKDAGSDMSEIFESLQEDLKKKTVPKPDFTLAFYHNYDMVKQICTFTCAYGYKTAQKEPRKKPEGLVYGKVPEHRAVNVDHLGSYQNLGNAWTGSMIYLRADKMKTQKEIPMYEIYRTMPGLVEDKDVLTSIFLPVK